MLSVNLGPSWVSTKAAPHRDGRATLPHSFALPPPSSALILSLVRYLGSSGFSPFMVEKKAAFPPLPSKLTHLTRKEKGPPLGTGRWVINGQGHPRPSEGDGYLPGLPLDHELLEGGNRLFCSLQRPLHLDSARCGRTDNQPPPQSRQHLK